MKPIAEYLAEFILLHHRGPEYKDYRRRCLEHWRQHYGEDVARKVEAIIRAKWNAK